MQNPNQTQAHYRQTASIFSAIQWTSGILALSLTIAVGTLVTGDATHPARAAAAIGSVGVVLFGSGSRRDYEDMTETARKITESLNLNAIAWVYAQTQPTRTALRRVESSTDYLSPLPLFDWVGLADSDEHPVLAIVAPMGGGKSRLAKWLARHVCFPNAAPEIGAIDIYGRKKDWVTVASTPPDILDLMREDLLILETREASYRDGEDVFSPIFRVFEEAPDTLITLSNDKKSRAIVDRWLMKFTTTTRKVKARLCLVSVKLAGASIGMGAESRDDATIIFPGLRGISKAMNDTNKLKLGASKNQLLRERLLASLDGVKHPALVYHQGNWYPASIPDLDSAGNPVGQTYHPELREYLEPLAEYLKAHPGITNRDLKKNWGRNVGANAETVDSLLTILLNYSKIYEENGGIYWSKKTP